MSKDFSRPPSKNLGNPLRVVFNTIFIFLLSQFVAALIAYLALALTHPHQSIALDQSVDAQFAYILFAESLAAFLVWSLVKRHKVGLGFIGFGRRPKWSDLWKAVIWFGIFYGLLIISSVILSALIPSLNFNQSQDIGFSHLNSALDGVLAFLALVILPPLGEETLLRGYLYSGLRVAWKFWPAAILTSVLFGLAHLQGGTNASLIWAAAIDTCILSFVLVYLREKTGALYAGILVHMLNNLLAFSAHFHGVLF